jgi:hypothetical protein
LRTHLLCESDALAQHGQAVGVDLQQAERLGAQVGAYGAVVAGVLGAHQRDRGTRLVGARCSAGAVHVHLWCVECVVGVWLCGFGMACACVCVCVCVCVCGFGREVIKAADITSN